MSYMGTKNHFARRLRELREAANLSQSELTDLAGMHRQGVGKLERGERSPAWETVQALARALGVDCTAFQTEDLPPQTTAEPKKGTKRK
jgi:transcriptional regulator with XRE-family HTH domain